MEFFAQIPTHNVSADTLSDRLRIATLPAFCASIDTVLSEISESEGEIYCLWGQFQVARQRLKKGVRFALLNCPHALAWTITCHQDGSLITVHCTIDKPQEDEDFVESIRLFVADWAAGLKQFGAE
jgi:hypothetical protein